MCHSVSCPSLFCVDVAEHQTIVVHGGFGLAKSLSYHNIVENMVGRRRSRINEKLEKCWEAPFLFFHIVKDKEEFHIFDAAETEV